jgi:hypothetical protein
MRVPMNLPFGSGRKSEPVDQLYDLKEERQVAVTRAMYNQNVLSRSEHETAVIAGTRKRKSTFCALKKLKKKLKIIL